MNDKTFKLRLPEDLLATAQEAAKRVGNGSVAEYVRSSLEACLARDGFIEAADKPATVACPYCGRAIAISVK